MALSTIEARHDMAMLAQIADYDYLRFTVTDINGVSRCKLVNKHCFKRYFEEGVTLYEAVAGICFRGELFPDELISDRPLYHGNVAVLPQPGTLHPLPAANCDHIKIGEVLCELRYMYDGTDQQACPRYAARTQLNRLKELGYDTISSYELEWLLLDEGTHKPAFESPGQVFNGPSMAKFSGILFEIDKCLQGMDIHLDTIQTEYAPGQIEFAGKPQPGITAPDHAVLMKDCIHEVTQKHQKKAVFMTKSFKDLIASNSLHFNISLKDNDGDNAFYDETDENKMSKMFYHWLAGVIKHARALTAFCNPTVNCYRRMHHVHSWTPCYATWGIDDRSACFRIKNHSKMSTYMECRLPSGAANPYLVVAAVVAAGVDGIENNLECPARATYTNGSPDGKQITFPYTLSEALEALTEDEYMVQTLGPELVKWFTINKRFELKELNESVVTNDDDFEENFIKERDIYFRL